MMKVQLKVLTGSSSGKTIHVPVSGFVIGRGEDCQLRPNSEAVSRHHCRVAIRDGAVVVSDMGSRNGTYVNGVQIDSETTVAAGDILAVGPLQFEILTAPAPAAHTAKLPGPNGSSEAVWGEDDISQWLDEGKDKDADAVQRITAETRQFRFDDTERLVVKAKESNGDQDQAAPEAEPDPHARTRKLKVPPPPPTKDTQEAAAQTLRRLFNRG